MTDFLFAVGCCSMGASVLAATYGYHGVMEENQRIKWNLSVEYQQLGSLPLLFMRNKKSLVPGYLALAGTAMFCLPLYYSALTEDRTFNKIMPAGGILMMTSWVALGLLA